MMWASITILAVMAMNLGFTLARHGEERRGRYNFWSSLAVAGVEAWFFR